MGGQLNFKDFKDFIKFNWGGGWAGGGGLDQYTIQRAYRQIIHKGLSYIHIYIYIYVYIYIYIYICIYIYIYIYIHIYIYYEMQGGWGAGVYQLGSSLQLGVLGIRIPVSGILYQGPVVSGSLMFGRLGVVLLRF